MTQFQAAMIATALEDARGQGCILCGKPSLMGGVWYPTEPISKALGAPEGKKRVVLYAVCSEHGRKKFGRAIEDTLLRENGVDPVTY